MIRSLRNRLFVALTAVIMLTSAAGAVFAYKWAFDEAIEIQDSALIQVAGLAHSGKSVVGGALHGVEENADIWLIELGNTPRGNPDERRLFTLQDGLHGTTVRGQPVRVLLGTRAEGSRFAVAQPTAVRDETARDMALRTLLPIALLVPCLLLVTALIIAHSLRPIVSLAENLDARRADDLAALPTAGTPSELQPFIVSINALLARIGSLMEQQRRFLADAAHELRTPITALSLQAENLEAVSLSADARDRAAALRQGVQRTKHLLDQLLALARYEASPSSPDPRALLALDGAAREVVADLMPRAIDRGIDLGFERIERVDVRCEAIMATSIIRNLLDNALRFTPDGGRIDLDIYPDGDAAVLCIADTGPGIAACEIDRVFEPFFRGSRPDGDGTGLGLAIVARIVASLDGTIILANRDAAKRSGLEVTIRLPAACCAGDPQPT